MITKENQLINNIYFNY